MKKARKKSLMDRQVHIPRPVVYVFAGIVVLFLATSIISNYFPNGVTNGILAVLALPPVLLLTLLAGGLGLPVQGFVDWFFFVMAIQYWIGLSIGMNVVYGQVSRICKFYSSRFDPT